MERSSFVLGTRGRFPDREDSRNPDCGSEAPQARGSSGIEARKQGKENRSRKRFEAGSVARGTEKVPRTDVRAALFLLLVPPPFPSCSRELAGPILHAALLRTLFGGNALSQCTGSGGDSSPVWEQTEAPFQRRRLTSRTEVAWPAKLGPPGSIDPILSSGVLRTDGGWLVRGEGEQKWTQKYPNAVAARRSTCRRSCRATNKRVLPSHSAMGLSLRSARRIAVGALWWRGVLVQPTAEKLGETGLHCQQSNVGV